MALFPVGVLVGMAVAWRWATMGAIVAIASLVALYLRDSWIGGQLPSGRWFVILTSPAVCFLLAPLIEHRPRDREDGPEPGAGSHVFGC